MNRTVLTLSILLLLAGGLTFAGNIAEETVVYGTVDGVQVKGFLAKPEGSGPFPTLILIHEWWGLNEHIHDNARAFANEGYVALAVDLYKGESTKDPKVARQLAGGVSSNMEQAFDNLRAAVSFLKARSDVSSDRLASVGWCFGGGWSYQMAKNDLDVEASVIYYGRFNPKDDLSKMRATILGNFGEKDRGIKVDTVREFQAVLKTLSGDHEIYIYPNAGHGFANSEGRAYNREAADLAWERTFAFLKKYL